MIRELSIPSLLKEGKKTAGLAVPLIIGQVSQMLMIITDTVMVGKVGVTELAALTFASSIFSIPFVFGIGLITSISVLSSGAAGRQDHTGARAVCRNGFYLALGSGVILCVLSFGLMPFLSLFHQPEGVTAITPPYLSLILISLIPVLGSMGLKNHSDSLGYPWSAFFIFLGGVILNILLNYLFIFTLGYGLVGAGWATLFSRIAILVGMLVWFHRSKKLQDLTPNRWIAATDPATFRKLFALGIPASFHLLAEVGAFSGAGFLVGLHGEVPLAAHQIALTTAGTFFMVPLGIAIALTMRMGNATGAQEKARYPAIVVSGWLLTIIFVGITALICSLGRETLADLYVKEADVASLAAQFLLIVAVFQIFDGLQVVSGGILRGLEDVKIPAWAAFVSYWIFGIPTGLALAYWGGLGATGIWWGLATGLAVAAFFLSIRVVKIAR